MQPFWQPLGIAHLFSVTYEGWRAPPRKLNPKTRFTFIMDAIPKGDTLAMHPSVPLPDCAR
jgi:hypothetical protein